MKNQFTTKIKTSMVLLAAALIAMITPSAGTARPPSATPTATLLASGLGGTQGSTVGPDGALYVTENLEGRIWRVDRETGQVTTFARGLPAGLFGIGNGGVVDVAFIGKTAYALVTGVASDSGGTSVVGIYRVDGPERFTVVADIGDFNLLNPPTIPFHFDLPTGFQFAMETYRGGFLVTDANLNRVLRVTLDGEISVFIDFENIVPTGLAVRGNTIYMAEGGSDPHLPQTGKVVSFGPKSSTVTQVASGAPWVLDVQFGLGRSLYALSFGTFDPNTESLNLAVPNTGALVKVNGDGTFTTVMDGLDQPTSLEFIRGTAYVVTLTGEIWRIDGVSGPPFGPTP
ncbi:MAG TPA: ScyD/ScyE family protein [Verrucomicrobiae bacterium]|nr:ScyD/ScyE family protein [Verrucomicrobiae bacterium]